MPLPPSSVGVDWITTPNGLPAGYYRNGPDIGDNGSSTYVPVIDKSLLFYYKFNAGDINGSNKLKNYATGTYDATSYYGASINTSNQKFGSGCLYLNGTSSQYIQLPTFTSDLNGITIAFWLNAPPTTNSSVRVFEFSNGQVSNNILYRPQYGATLFQNSVVNWQNVGGGYNDSTWKFMVWTMSCTNATTKVGTWEYLYQQQFSL